MSVTLVSGVPGVGASTVAAEAVSELDDYRLFNFGDAMLEAAAVRGIAESRDELSELSANEQAGLQRYAAGYVRDEASEGPVVVTTSFAVRTEDGYFPGLPDPVLYEMSPDRLVVVEAEPKTVVERRKDGEYRDYPEPTESGIRFHQRMNRTAAFVYSSQSSATVHHVPNENGVEEATEKLTSVLSR
jgi:adenylate kinase